MNINIIGTINNQEIQTISINNIEFVYLIPICSALGISYEEEINEVKENDFVCDKYKLLSIVLNEIETYSIAIPLKYMLGYIGVLSKKTNLSKDEYLQNKKLLLDMIYKQAFK